MKTTPTIAFLAASLTLAICFAPAAHADPFGSGLNSFEIDFVTIGNPGNPDQVIGFSPLSQRFAGSVAQSFRMGTFEISEDMINKANAIGSLGLTHTGRGTKDLPATGLSWFEAAQFVNWLNTSTGATPAYKFDGGGNFQLWQPGDAGYDPNNLFRNSQSVYFLPSFDEWHKAAYYDPIAEVYYVYPTGSDSVPDGIDSINTPGQDPNFDAVFSDGASSSIPNKIMNVGVSSPYGTLGQGGNVSEWVETECIW